MQRFTGPYSQPKTARSRVPNTSGGTLPPRPPVNRFGIPDDGRRVDGGRPFKGRMAPRPSLSSLSWGRAMRNMRLATGTPGGGAAAFAFAFGMNWANTWSRMNAGQAGYQFGAGWTVLCTVPPNPLEPERKVGINPGAIVGSTDVVARNCNVSGANTANSAYGVAIPAGATYFQAVCSGVPLPNRNGRVFQRASYFPGTSPVPVPYTTGTVVLPNPDGLEQVDAVAQPQPSRGSKGRYTLPYQSEAVTIVLTRPRDDTRGRPGPGTRPRADPGGGIIRNDDPVNNVPPGPTEREVKVKTPLGKSLASLRHQYGKLTEVGDVAKCLEKALPPGHPCRRKGRGLDERVACLVEHSADIDLGAAAACIAMDQVTDAVVGKLSRVASRNLQKSPYTPKRPYPLGPLTGGFGARMR